MDYQLKYNLGITLRKDDVDQPVLGNLDRGFSRAFDKLALAGDELAPGAHVDVTIPANVAGIYFIASKAMDLCITAPTCLDEETTASTIFHVVPLPALEDDAEDEKNDAVAFFLPLDPTKAGPTQITVTNPDTVEDGSFELGCLA